MCIAWANKTKFYYIDFWHVYDLYDSNTYVDVLAGIFYHSSQFCSPGDCFLEKLAFWYSQLSTLKRPNSFSKISVPIKLPCSEFFWHPILFNLVQSKGRQCSTGPGLSQYLGWWYLNLFGLSILLCLNVNSMVLNLGYMGIQDTSWNFNFFDVFFSIYCMCVS